MRRLLALTCMGLLALAAPLPALAQGSQTAGYGAGDQGNQTLATKAVKAMALATRAMVGPATKPTAERRAPMLMLKRRVPLATYRRFSSSAVLPVVPA